jgi:hypothetical protein
MVALFSWSNAVDATSLPTFGDALSDFSEVAGLLSCRDLLISVDSSMAHLAGALGIPVWVLLHTPKWRWLLDCKDSPWYPTTRLFKQRQHSDWNEVVARVAIELQRFVGRRAQMETAAHDSALLGQMPHEQ